jgi:hypothetical protein
MAYQVDKFNGTFLTSVEDGTIDSTTDLRFVGKNYAGYGEVQNENFLHLLENFANTTAPPKTITGQIWFDSANKKLKFYDGSRYKVAGGAEVSTTAPSGLAVGEFWWDSTAKQLYTYTGTDFVLVGPEASPDLGTSAVTASVVKDTLNNNHTIVKMLSAGKVIAIVSQDAFTLNSTVNPIQDFAEIKKGITLVKTNTSGVSTDDYVYWGSASNALRLGGVAADQFVQKGSVTFDNAISFTDPGFELGDSNDLRVRVENSDEVIVENRLGNPITMRITVTEGSDERDVAVFRSTGVVPGQDGVYTLGTTLSKWSNVYATTFTGNLTGNVTGNLTGSATGSLLATDTTILVNGTTKEIGYDGATLRGTLFGNVQGNVTGTASNAGKLNEIDPLVAIPSTSDKTSIPVRDASGNINATQFIGTTDKADRLKIDNSATDTDVNYRSAKTTATANTIAARDSSGDLYAALFQGTATAARYADLAEKYLADAEYEPGTVMVIGGEQEVTACNAGQRAIGVISTNPAFMMNKDLDGGVYVALKGRVPVKVNGPVKKGDQLVADNNGAATVWHTAEPAGFAIALESNDNEGIKLVEALVL